MLGDGYDRLVPPRSTYHSENVVAVSIGILEVFNIRPEQGDFEFKFELTLEWYEQRALYHNLKGEAYQNTLRKEDMDRLWLPMVDFPNAVGLESRLDKDVMKGTTSVIVRNGGNFTRSSVYVADEIEIFQGNENKLNLKQRFHLRVMSSSISSFYPFDTQSLELRLEEKRMEAIGMKLKPGIIVLKNALNFPNFEVKNHYLDSHSTRGIFLRLEIKRKPSLELATTLLPSLFLLIISSMSSLLDQSLLHTRLCVCLSALLAQTGLLAMASLRLPSTSSITLVHVWLISGQCFSFLHILIIIARRSFMKKASTPLSPPSSPSVYQLTGNQTKDSDLPTEANGLSRPKSIVAFELNPSSSSAIPVVLIFLGEKLFFPL